jgi:hypothetical protein
MYVDPWLKSKNPAAQPWFANRIATAKQPKLKRGRILKENRLKNKNKPWQPDSESSRIPVAAPLPGRPIPLQ